MKKETYVILVAVLVGILVGGGIGVALASAGSKESSTNYNTRNEDEKETALKEEENKKDEEESSSKNDEKQDNPTEEPETFVSTTKFIKYAKESDITREDGKVNIYLFWGDGCPHCESEYEFLEEIDEEYGKYYNVYGLEVWDVPENKALYDSFVESIGAKITGVPLTVIGDRFISGYKESYRQQILDAIEAARKSNFDRYFDKIKK